MLNEKSMGMAFAYAAALFWLICSIFVYLLPDMMMGITGDLIHADFTNMAWHMPLGGMITGLIVWSVGSGLFGWFVAIFYNKSLKKLTSE